MTLASRVLNSNVTILEAHVVHCFACFFGVFLVMKMNECIVVVLDYTHLFVDLTEHFKGIEQLLKSGLGGQIADEQLAACLLFSLFGELACDRVDFGGGGIDGELTNHAC